jgi:tRNA(Ile)-lysidine synthase
MFHRSADGMYIRPLLDVTRVEIEGYAASRNLCYCTDSSNSDTSFLRNRIRLQLLPLLSGYNPAIALRLAETASIMAADEALLSGVVLNRWHQVGEKSEDRITLNAESLRMDLTGMRYRLYRRSIEMLNGNLRRISYRHLQGVDRLLLEGPPNGSLNLPDGLVVIRSYGKMVFTHKTGDVEDTGFEITILSEGDHYLPSGGKIVVSSCEDEISSTERSRMEMIVNLEEFPFPWTIRTFKPGDRIVPRGMKGHKKVKDIFIDGKVPRADRREIPLFFSGDNLFWVPDLTRGGKACQNAPYLRKVRVQLLEFMQDAAMLA